MLYANFIFSVETILRCLNSNATRWREKRKRQQDSDKLGSDGIEVHAAGGIMGMHGTRDLHTNGE